MKCYEEEFFEEKCYELYKLDWMLHHDYTLTDLLDRMKDNAEMDVDDDAMSSATDGQSARTLIGASYSEVEDEGFDGGEIWACMEEFLQSEFLDKDYMMHLFSLTNNKKMLTDTYEKMMNGSQQASEKFNTLVNS